MNEDESTQTLSDKVLDRANVLRFAKPQSTRANGRATQEEEVDAGSTQEEEVDAGGYLKHSQWQDWIQPQLSNSWDQEVQSWCEQINDALDKVGRPFGHRVDQAIQAYVRNYPGVGDGQTHKYAFADQVEQKILPKLRGIDVTEDAATKAIDEISVVINDLGDEALRLTFEQSRTASQSTGTFLWRGVTRELE